MSKRQTVKFQAWVCRVERLTYNNGRPALTLVDAKDGEAIATATVNLPNEPIGEGCVFIKDYSENAGMLQALEAAKVVKATGRVVSSGFVQVPEARLL